MSMYDKNHYNINGIKMQKKKKTNKKIEIKKKKDNPQNGRKYLQMK